MSSPQPTPKTPTWVKAILISGASAYAISILLHLYLITFARFIADDYCSAWRAQVMGILRATYAWYRIWSGRFSANFLDALTGAFGTEFYPWSIILTLMLWVLCAALLAEQLIRRLSGSRSRLSAYLLAFAAVAAIMNTLPVIEQSIYWGQGMRALLPPLILLPLFAALLLKLNPTPLTRSKLILASLAAGMCGIFAGGFSETGFVALFSISLLGAIYLFWIKQKRLAWLCAAFMLGTLLAFAVMWLSPGRAIRQDFFTPTTALLPLVIVTVRSFSAWLWQNLSQHALTLFTFFAAVLFICAQLLPPTLNHPRYRKSLLLAALATVLVAFICFLPAAFTMSDTLPPRTEIIPQSLLITALAALAAWCASLLKPVLSTRPRLVYGAVVCIAVAIIAANANAMRTTLILLEKYQIYAQQWQQQHETIRAAASQGKTSILVPRLENPAFLDGLTAEPNYWLNKCYSSFYNIEVTAPESPSSR